MAHIPHGIPRGFFLAMVGVLCATLLAPVAASADTDLVIGGQARIAYANGDDVRLRDEPAYESNVLALIPESTILEVLDGPFEATDASFWYYVAYNGQQGYMDATFLQVYGGEEAPPPVEDVPVEDIPVTTEEPAPPAPQEAQVTAGAVGAVTGYGVIAGTNGDGVRCRADAGSGSATITVLPEGTEVELTGAAIDVWQPVNCAGNGGFVHNAYVSYDGAPPAGDDGIDPEPEAEQPAEEEPAPTEDDSTFEASATVTGSATVAGTNGDGVRCRDGAGTDSSTITVLSEGTVVNLRGGAEGDWQPVLCAGRNGWAHVSYLSYSGVPGGDDDGGEADEATAQASGVARVTGTGGGGLNCRSSAQMGNNVITILSEGASVELRGAPQGSWQPVICAGRNGFASVDYLSSTGGGDDGGGDDGGSGGGGSTVTGQGQVTNADGGLNCRSSAQMGNNVITILPDGSRVDLRGGAQGDWQPVVCAGRNGFVHVDYISVGSSGGGGDDGGGSSGGGGGSNSGFSEGMAVEVSGTNGDGLRLRSGASSGSSTITVMSEGTVVSVIGGSSGDWVAVSFDGIEGFAHMDYLTASDGTPSGGGGDDGGSSGGGGGGGWRLSAGDHAATTDALNLRYEPSSSAGVAAVAPAGTVVEITGSPSNGYYPVNWDGLSGYMYNSYLSWTDAGLSDRGGSGNNGGGDDGGGSNGGGAGSGSMVDFAMQYLGYPYVWATAGPGSFDCSGFTYWVTLNVLGQDIGRGLWTQVAAGTPVSRGNLQPGDLVFFQNTYTWGLSHVGIYIGGGQFIHAENENTGVKISDLGSNYYSSRWYGAVRLT